ncbi:MAG: methyl-accepting chemotaxis protein [Elusimicrobia bacterium]|nr:methyl-accepting chemotaxis protein [Elusimicrobiota bacterium]
MGRVRRQYIVKPNIQIRYLLLLAGIIVVLAILIYYMFLDTLLSSPGMDQLSAGSIKNFVRTYTSGFFWVTLIFMSAVLIESIFYFHRIVGPIYFFEKVMNKISEGDFSLTVHHRKKDETVELAENMNKAIGAVRTVISQDREKIKQINAARDNGNKDEAKRLLGELMQWFKTEKAE